MNQGFGQPGPPDNTGLINTILGLVQLIWAWVQDILTEVGDVEDEIEELEQHFHHAGTGTKWFGATNNVGVDQTPGIRDGIIPYQLTSGNPADTWGAFYQIFDGTETPVDPGMTEFDPNTSIALASNQNNTLWHVQIWAGPDVASRVLITTVAFYPVAGNSTRSGAGVAAQQCPVGDLIWMRAKAAAGASKTLDLIFALHEYPS